MRRTLLLSILFLSAIQLNAQQTICVFKPPQITIHFGKGDVRDVNTGYINYNRVSHYCPQDGFFSYTPFTSNCFGGDWHTLTEDHTPGDADGNMLLINASHTPGSFFRTTIAGLKANTTYEFGVWMMNVCRITEKCPFPLLPNITIRLQTPEGKVLAQFNTGEVPRVPTPAWTQHRALFKTLASATELQLIMVNNAPGGCGNDFALDDITFRECIIQTNPVTKSLKPPTDKKQSVVPPKKSSTSTATNKPLITPKINETKGPITEARKPSIDSSRKPIAVIKEGRNVFPPPPSVLVNRDNPLVKRIETTAGEIRVELYDNGQIDGDTVSIYHNNILIKSHARLSEKPISFNIAVNASEPYHELIMVANNLGSIPPNTSVMIITAGNMRHEVFISSTEQKNAKVVLDLKK